MTMHYSRGALRGTVDEITIPAMISKSALEYSDFLKLKKADRFITNVINEYYFVVITVDNNSVLAAQVYPMVNSNFTGDPVEEYFIAES